MLLAVITALGSCKKSDFSHENQFDRSYQAWLDFKKNSLDSYSYKVSAGSWTGVSAETVITVKSGKVAGRSYELKNINRTTNQPYTMTSWKESSDSLNTQRLPGYYIKSAVSRAGAGKNRKSCARFRR